MSSLPSKKRTSRVVKPRPSLVSRQLKIADAEVAAGEADRAFPIGEARAHPALRFERRAIDREIKTVDRDMPRGRNFSACDIGDALRRHGDLGVAKRRLL